MEHDLFLCKNCFEEHSGHLEAQSIKNLLTKEFNHWSTLLTKISETKTTLERNLGANRNIIGSVRSYYSSQNN